METLTYEIFITRAEVFFPCVLAYCLLCYGVVGAAYWLKDRWSRPDKSQRAKQRSL